jgi:RNA ligase
MTTRLGDLFDLTLLDQMTAEGYVRVQRHPTLPLSIYNYTEKAQYGSVWNDVTLRCRGLIVDAASGTVLARPFAKFFNHGQPDAPLLDPSDEVVVTDKADGSLGVLHPLPEGGFAVATRGSFDSTQARHANQVWRARYADRFAPPPGVTVLFEIIYPDNRIVIDYAGLDDLVLLGGVEIATGRTVPVDGWPGPIVETFAYPTLADALAAPPRDNREGLVVHRLKDDVRVKVKYEDYLRLHRIVTGLNARKVWESLLTPAGFDELVADLPDEFHAWATGIATELTAQVDVLAAAVESAYASIVAGLPEGWTRKDFALVAAKHPERASLFHRLDDHDYRAVLWQRVKPAMTETDEEES